MQRVQNWGDVFAPASAVHNPGGHVLHSLQSRDLCLGDSTELRVTVVDSRRNKDMYQLFCCPVTEQVPDTASVAQVV